MNLRRSVAIVASLVATWLVTARSETLLTLAQRDADRSARAPRSADVSADGRWVAFESLARLVAADTDDRLDIYLLDRTTGRVTLESGALGDDDPSHPRISGDGRFLVFESRPSQSIDAARADVVLLDRLDGTIRVLTNTPQNNNSLGWSRSPDISDNGLVVAFSSAARGLVAGPDVNRSSEDVYVVQLPGGVVTRASATAAGAQFDRGDSILPALSADGRWLAFASTAFLEGGPSSTGPNRDRRVRQIFLRDAIGGRVTRVSRAANGGLPNGDSSLPSISADGRHLAFVSEASNLLNDDENNAADVFLYDREADALSWVSRAPDGSSAGGESTNPDISGNGRFVAFQSDAANLACVKRCPEEAEDINLLWDTFLFDRTSGHIIRISEDELGGWMEASAGATLDSTGHVVAFSSRHPIDAADRGGDFDLFVRTLTPPPAVTRKSP